MLCVCVERERERERERAGAAPDHHQQQQHLNNTKGVDRHSRPEPLYFWFYFVVVNGIWIVVPIVCIITAARRINAAVARAEGGGGAKRAKAK